MDVNSDSSPNGAMDPGMALSSSLYQTLPWYWVATHQSWVSMTPAEAKGGQQLGHREQPRFWVSTGPSVVTVSFETNTDPNNCIRVTDQVIPLDSRAA